MEREALARIEKLRIGNHRPQRQIARPSSAGHPLLELQRSVGNQAIQRLTGSPFIQAKLQAPVAVREDDEEEKSLVQRACVECEEEEMVHRESGAQTATPKVTNSVAANIHAMNGGGSPLPATTRAFFEPRFGADFSHVRVHTDSRAATTANSIQAKAFTVGPNIAFGTGRYAPHSPEGRQLLAHELTHVVQQTAGGTTQRKLAEPAVVQRDSSVKITKKLSDNMSRAEVQQVLQEFFEKTMKAQGGKSVSMTEDVKNTLRRILLNDMPGLMKLDSYLGRSIFPGSPAELAKEVAKYLPDPLEASRLAHLGASSGPDPSTMKRVGDLVKKTEPYESPDTLENKWKFEREATELRKGEGAIGPFGVDLNRILNIGKGLPGAVKSPPSQKAVEARSYPQVNDAIAKISKTALIPAEAKGTPNADNFADAQLVAQDLARLLDIAYQQKNDNVTVRLTPNYNDVKDRVEMIREFIKIVQLIRDALPHQASGVSAVDLYFGDRLMQRIPLGGKSE